MQPQMSIIQVTFESQHPLEVCQEVEQGGLAPARHVGLSRFVSAWPCPVEPFSSKQKKTKKKQGEDHHGRAARSNCTCIRQQVNSDLKHHRHTEFPPFRFGIASSGYLRRCLVSARPAAIADTMRSWKPVKGWCFGRAKGGVLACQKDFSMNGTEQYVLAAHSSQRIAGSNNAGW